MNPENRKLKYVQMPAKTIGNVRKPVSTTAAFMAAAAVIFMVIGFVALVVYKLSA